MKIVRLLLVPSLFLAPSAVVVAFAPRILVSKTYKPGYQNHSCWSPPWHRLGAISSVSHCSSSSSKRSNHNVLLSGNEGVWDRLTLSAEIDRTVPFAGVRASGFIVAAAAVAAGAFVLLASRAAVGSFRRGAGSYSAGDSGATPVSARERARSSSSLSPWTRTTTKMLGAWRCSGNTNAELIKNLIDSNLVRSPRVAKALQATDRGFYAGQDAYEDRPQPIGFRATISAPHMHAHALEVLSPAIPREGGKVLDVGCGSGYLTGALARLVGVDGVVFGMDYIPNLVALSRANLDKDDPTLLSSGRVHLETGDGWKGWPENGPFDAIHVGAAAETIPEDLVSQLKVGGRMVVPVGPQSASQMLVQVDRIKDTGPISESYTTEGLMAVVYVPLVNT